MRKWVTIICSILWAGHAAAGDAIRVTAAVETSCAVSTQGLTFDAQVTVPDVAADPVRVTCTPGTRYSLSAAPARETPTFLPSERQLQTTALFAEVRSGEAEPDPYANAVYLTVTYH
ncbi:MAG: hypothetical protein KIT73_04610 [Burkholderiales bacterium]|nr:hypothetical protein [Burkholderiales bacterium]